MCLHYPRALPRKSRHRAWSLGDVFLCCLSGLVAKTRTTDGPQKVYNRCAVATAPSELIGLTFKHWWTICWNCCGHVGDGSLCWICGGNFECWKFAGVFDGCPKVIWVGWCVILGSIYRETLILTCVISQNVVVLYIEDVWRRHTAAPSLA